MELDRKGFIYHSFPSPPHQVLTVKFCGSDDKHN